MSTDVNDIRQIIWQVCDNYISLLDAILYVQVVNISIVTSLSTLYDLDLNGESNLLCFIQSIFEYLTQTESLVSSAEKQNMQQSVVLTGSNLGLRNVQNSQKLTLNITQSRATNRRTGKTITSRAQLSAGDRSAQDMPVYKKKRKSCSAV